MSKINTIARYDSAYELLQEFCGAEFWDEIGEDDDIFLRHFDDFEGFTYYAIDGAIYVTEFLGDVIDSCPDFDTFLRQIIGWLEDDREERGDEG